MKIAYNPITASALTSAPNNNDITFDLKGLSIFVKGVQFKGTDTTYSVFKKYTSASSGGYNGLVPAPSYTTTNIRYLREDGTWQVPSSQYTYSQLDNTDLNTLKTEGQWYYIAGSSTNTNGPTNFNSGAELYVGRNASGYRYQRAILVSGQVWFRIWNSTSWGSWTRWYTDQNTDTKVTQSSTTTSNFRPIVLGYQNSTTVDSLGNTVTEQVYTSTKVYVQPSTGTLIATKFQGQLDWNNISNKPGSFTPSAHTHTTNQITALTGYTKSTSNGTLSSTDSLNTALGKLEYKGDLGVTAYNIVNAAYDGDGTIENLQEILKVLEGISDTDTIKNLLGKYVLKTGDVMTGRLTIGYSADANALILNHTGTSVFASTVGFGNDGGILGYLGVGGSGSSVSKQPFFASSLSGTLYPLLHSGNYTQYITKIGTATVGGTAKPIYLNAGTPTALSATVGGTNRPVFLNAGTITQCSYAFGNANGNASINNGTVNTNLNADMLDGYHRNNLYASVANWISAVGLTKSITVTGDKDTYYPVVITVSTTKTLPTIISIWKNLGSTTPSISGNHANGTSSLWLIYEMRSTTWDGNGGFVRTVYKAQSYGTLVARAINNTRVSGSLIVWLRGGTCQYNVTCTNSFSATPYYTTTNIDNATYPYNVSPMTTIDNGGIVGGITWYGNATTSSKWLVTRTLTLTGAITGSASIDGSGNITLTTSINHSVVDGNYVKKSGDTMTGLLTIITSDYANQLTIYRNTSDGNSVINYSNSSGLLGRIGICGSAGTFPKQPFFNNGITDFQLLHSGNYTTYTVTKTGGGANGTWGISITGNAASATKLNSRGNLTALSGLSMGDSGLSMYQVYSNGYPTTYGNLIHVRGLGAGELLLGWSGTNGGYAGLYYRNHRDNEKTANWSSWVTVLDSNNYTSFTNGNYVTSLGTSGNYVTWTKNGTTNNLTVPYAVYATYLQSSDTRSVSNTPAQFSAGARFEFKSNSTDGLSNGGGFHGILHFRPYGSGTDFSGGQTHQLGFTDNGNLYMRTSTSSSVWGAWKLILNQTTADGRYVTALGTNGNYLTWTKNGVTNNITVPYATYANSVYTGAVSGSTHAEALKNYFNSNKSVARNRLISFYSSAYSNGSQYFGYFLNGYDSNPYGGFFIAHYGTPYYVGISSGTFTQQTLVTSTNHTSILTTYFRYLGNNTTSDWNAITSSGNTRISNLTITNGPSGAYNYGQLLTFNAGGTLSQIYLPHSNTGGMYIRTGQSGVEQYYSWIQVLTSVNYSSIINANYYTKTEADDRYVNVTGDTMVGTLHMKPTTGSYTEGIRLYGTAASNTWSNINFGCDPSASSGTHTNQWILGRNSSNNFVLDRGNSTGANGFIVTTTGNFGLGTTSPSYKLHVAGVIYSTSTTNANSFVSRVATGTQPYACSSTTLNTNLNADMLDGRHGSSYLFYDTYGNYADYQRGVIGLCQITSYSQNGNWATGTLYVGRDNGIYNDCVIYYSIHTIYNSTNSGTTAYVNYTSIGNQLLQPCTFTYNGKKYVGFVFNSTTLSINGVRVMGWKSLYTTPFWVWYYNSKSATVLNSEINNSLVVNGSDLTISKGINGNATTASKWLVARTLTLVGAVTGSATIDGSGNVSLNTTYSTGNISALDGRYVKKTGDTMTGKLTISAAINQMLALTSSYSTGEAAISYQSTISSSNGRWVVGKGCWSTGNNFTWGIDSGTGLTTGAKMQLSPSGVLTILGNKVWHQGNDGAGSGLDADLLDGIDSIYYARTSQYNHGNSSSVAYTPTTYVTNFANSSFFTSNIGTWYYAGNGYVNTDWGNIHLAGTAISTWRGDTTNFTQLYITGLQAGGPSNPLLGEMLYYIGKPSGYTSGWTRVLTTRNKDSVLSNYMRFYRQASVNANNLTNSPVVCETNNGSNMPTTNTWHQVMNWGSGDGNYAFQLANTYTTNGDIYYRHKVNGTWYAWETIVDSGNIYSYSPNGYVMRAYTIDASSLNVNTYYPVTFGIGAAITVRIEVRVALNSGTKPSWSTHNSGFSTRKIWEVNGSGWGTNPVNRHILVSDYAYAQADPVRGVGQLTNGSIEYVYVRGGGKYHFYVSHNIAPTLQTSTYTNNSQSVAPTTTAPAAISVPYLSLQAGRFSALTYYPITGINTVYIPTNTSHLTNDSGFWTGTRYWANVAVSTSSSTGTSPTFSTAYTSNWFRSTGATGWYSQTYGGGIYMTDTSWVRTYNSKGMVASCFYATNWSSATYLLRSDGGAAAFNWSGQSGQPTWVWGGNSQHSYYVYNPSNFNVNSAQGAHYLFAHYNGGQRVNPQTYFNYGIGVKVAMTGLSSKGTSYWCDTLWINGYTGTDVPNMCALHFNRDGTPRMYISAQSNRATAYGTLYQVYTTYSLGTVGSSTKGIYASGGVFYQMTYSLVANVNAGSAGKLAYYSGTNSIDDYTSTVGSSSTPIYLNAGVPTACNIATIKYFASYKISLGAQNNSISSYTRITGNYTFITGASTEKRGTFFIDCSFPSGFTINTTMIFGALSVYNVNDWTSPGYLTIQKDYSATGKFRMIVADDNTADGDSGYVWLYFLCI